MKYSPNAIYCIILLTFTACGEKTLFKQLSSAHTNIHFTNTISESDSLNPMNQVNIYNGGGVGIGDFNNDGLQDVYFTGNMVANKLYLNKGDMQFEDITDKAGVEGQGKWCRGVSVVDINNDGKQDIYISISIEKNPQKRQNILYVNQGNDKDGVPIFKDMAAEYGLNDTTHSTIGLFFDYDNDGDLDMYLVVNEHLDTDNPNSFRPIITNGSHPSTGRLYRNDWNETLKHGVFVNVSAEAGIKTEGYGHAGIITDINHDGWKDIYVTNDFLSANLLYINNHDGTFTDRSKEYFKQTSTFAMGTDMQDLNNDGLLDVVELDMNPQDNHRKKMMLGANSYQTMQNFDRYNYQYQYSKNTLQINQGYSVKQNDTIGIPVFSQVSFLSGISETDWSWTPMVTDFDDDGYRDIIITNGYPKDVTDHDFMVYRNKALFVATWDDILTQIPKVKLHNYAFRNKGNLTFENETTDWGLKLPSFSNGAAYADLDNDGDMDMVINNINDEAFVYQNNAANEKDNANNYLNITFSGSPKNPGGLGTWVDIYYDHDKHQVYEHSPYRGYVSSVQGMAHFGLGKVKTVDSVVVVWPDAKKQVLKNVSAGQALNVNIKNADQQYDYTHPLLADKTLFTEVTNSVGINYTDSEPDFVDFNIQKLLPHKFSEYSPGLAVGDLDGNGTDDILCGGNSADPTTAFFQRPDGKFTNRKLFAAVKDSATAMPQYYNDGNGKASKDEGILLFDADGDGDQDLYISSGGYEQKSGSPAYQDKLYINDGKGNFKIDSAALPQNYTSKFCVRAVDFDKDGDLDLFIAGRVDPWNYPKPVSSIILRNDSEKGRIKFTDVTASVAKDLENAGLVCDAVFTDFNNDGWPDLVLAGEWMPVTFLKNDKGIFKNVTLSSGTSNDLGWWNTIAPGDFDNDGDIDYIVGNLGLNSFYKASDKYPVYVTAKDFDNNGSYDAFPSIYLPISHEDQRMREYPVNQRDDIIKQVISMRARYTNYKKYASATIDSLFTPEQMKDVLRVKANTLASSYFRNDGNGKFTRMELPIQAQISVLGGMCVDDFDGDGNLDVVINGNDFGTDVSVGRYDALNGLFMKGDGKGNFIPQTIMESGIFIPGNGKALVKLKSAGGKTMIAASQRNGPLKIFKLKRSTGIINLLPSDISAIVKYKNGTTQKREFYFGYSFLSQGARFLNIDQQMVSVQIMDIKGAVRDVPLK
jgi:hypothetical protein